MDSRFEAPTLWCLDIDILVVADMAHVFDIEACATLERINQVDGACRSFSRGRDDVIGRSVDPQPAGAIEFRAIQRASTRRFSQPIAPLELRARLAVTAGGKPAVSG